MAFFVGQQVVCVDYPVVQHIDKHTVVGRVYTIREIYQGKAWDGPATGLRFEEIINQPDARGVEHGYDARRFRPVRKTDISIFTAMLTPVETRTPTKEPA